MKTFEIKEFQLGLLLNVSLLEKIWEFTSSTDAFKFFLLLLIVEPEAVTRTASWELTTRPL